MTVDEERGPDVLHKVEGIELGAELTVQLSPDDAKHVRSVALQQFLSKTEPAA